VSPKVPAERRWLGPDKATLAPAAFVPAVAMLPAGVLPAGVLPLVAGAIDRDDETRPGERIGMLEREAEKPRGGRPALGRAPAAVDRDGSPRL
jgi:hypothetical protein